MPKANVGNLIAVGLLIVFVSFVSVLVVSLAIRSGAYAWHILRATKVRDRRACLGPYYVNDAGFAIPAETMGWLIAANPDDHPREGWRCRRDETEPTLVWAWEFGNSATTKTRYILIGGDD